MRIGMLADVYKPHVSGVTHYIELNKRYFEQAGHEVFVFTFGSRDRIDDAEHVIQSPGLPLGSTGYSFSLKYSRTAKSLLETMDVVHIHHPFVSGRLALRYCKPLGIPTVFTNHTRYDLYARVYAAFVPAGISEWFLRAYMPAFCRAVDLVIAPSAGMAQVMRGMGVSSPIEIIHNGVALERFLAAEPLSRANFGYGENDILLVYTGRVAGEKNLPFLLRAFAAVASVLENVHLLVIGAGPKSVQAELRSLAVQLKLGDRVKFTGMIPYEQLPPYLRMCDAFVTASVSETHPLSVIEGMACGLPIMGVDSPGVGETVQDGVTGFLSGEDMPAFTAKLTRLCADAALRKKMGQAAREASTRYSIERTSQALLGHYQRLIAASQPARDSLAARRRGFSENHLP